MRRDPSAAVLGGPVRALSRAVVQTERSALRPLWGAIYLVAARLLAAHLTRGLPRTSVHLAGSIARGEAVYGLSDLDLVVVVRGGEAQARGAADAVAARRRLLRRLPGFDRLVSVSVYRERSLVRTSRHTCLTHGLGDGRVRGEADGGYLRPGSPRDELYRLIHPGLWGPAAPWRRISGPGLSPLATPSSAAYRRLACWLELQWWWRYSFLLAADPELHSAPYLCFKLFAEPARIWLRLAAGRRAGREEAIELCATMLPEEAPALDGARRLRGRLGRPGPPVAEAMGWLVRSGSRIAATIAADVAAEGTTEVELVGDGGARSPRGGRTGPGAAVPATVPLVDWRARAMPRRADEVLSPMPGDPADPAAVAAALRRCEDATQPALRRDGLLVLPADANGRSVLLRAVQSAASDPVSFALLDGSRVARFPHVAGWSARDCAQRAVAEHRNWLALRRWEDPRQGVERLITAARAGLFLEAVESGEPRLSLGSAATLGGLVERFPDVAGIADEALGLLAAGDGADVDPAVPAGLRAVVARLPVYGPDGATAVRSAKATSA